MAMVIVFDICPEVDPAAGCGVCSAICRIFIIVTDNKSDCTRSKILKTLMYN